MSDEKANELLHPRDLCKLVLDRSLVRAAALVAADSSAAAECMQVAKQAQDLLDRLTPTSPAKARIDDELVTKLDYTPSIEDLAGALKHAREVYYAYADTDPFESYVGCGAFRTYMEVLEVLRKRVKKLGEQYAEKELALARNPASQT